MRALKSRIARSLALALLATALAVPVAAADPGDRAACVGQFSSFFAHGGGGTIGRTSPRVSPPTRTRPG